MRLRENPYSIREWWCSLNDRQLFGIQCCFCKGGSWEDFGFNYLKESFHNGKKFIPGTSITFFGMTIQLSKVSDWAGCNHSGFMDEDDLFTDDIGGCGIMVK